METRLNHDSDRVELLERQLREARELAAESDRKFEEVKFLFNFKVKNEEYFYKEKKTTSQHKIVAAIFFPYKNIPRSK
jgi:hypothetical protein